MTKMILKTVSAIAIAAATLTAATAITGNAAAAMPRFPGHGPVVPNAPFKLPPVWQKLGGHLNITCLACDLPRPKPTNPRPNGNNEWNHWHGWHDRPESFGGDYQPMAYGGPAQNAPAYIAAQPAPVGCLTKQNLPDGSILFQDICTKQSAIAPPEAVGAR